MGYRVDQAICRDFHFASEREWLLTSGNGAYAMGTVSGANTRRYHGLLVAAMRPPADRTVLLSNLEVRVEVGGRSFDLSTHQYVGAVHPRGYAYLTSFHVGQVAEWMFAAGTARVSRQVVMHRGENTVTIRHTNHGDQKIRLYIRPLTASRSFHGNYRSDDSDPALSLTRDSTELRHHKTKLLLTHPGAERELISGWYYRFEHLREVERGLDPFDDLFCPCELEYSLEPGESCDIVASADGKGDAYNWASLEARPSESWAERLAESCRHFIVTGGGRQSIIAGYPWFNDWGRDTMISLPGICLANGELVVARGILASYAKTLRNGLIPNRFTDQGGADYHTVDGTLWFLQALYATYLAAPDSDFAKSALVWGEDVIDHHLKGTDFGIQVDPHDGLLRQGEPGTQLTWMDAKVGDLVITPRHGKPIEINALWINALRVMEQISLANGESGARYREWAEKAEGSFEAKFWKETLGYYLDTVDPDDASLRPNQLIAMSLPFGPAKGARALKALKKVEEELLTPVGLRTLSPKSAGYRPRFEGDMAQRDSAYHQGTVWPWLLGPYLEAVLKLELDQEKVRAILYRALEELDYYGLGGMAEVYDAEMPQRPGGCPWQAWSIAELTRIYHLLESGKAVEKSV